MSKVANIVEDLRNIETLAQPAQEQLISGTNIKTINGESVLGNGDLIVSTGVLFTKDFSSSEEVMISLPNSIATPMVSVLKEVTNLNINNNISAINGANMEIIGKTVPLGTFSVNTDNFDSLFGYVTFSSYVLTSKDVGKSIEVLDNSFTIINTQGNVVALNSVTTTTYLEGSWSIKNGSINIDGAIAGKYVGTLVNSNLGTLIGPIIWSSKDGCYFEFYGNASKYLYVRKRNLTFKIITGSETLLDGVTAAYDSSNGNLSPSKAIAQTDDGKIMVSLYRADQSQIDAFVIYDPSTNTLSKGITNLVSVTQGNTRIKAIGNYFVVIYRSSNTVGSTVYTSAGNNLNRSFIKYNATNYYWGKISNTEMLVLGSNSSNSSNMYTFNLATGVADNYQDNAILSSARNGLAFVEPTKNGYVHIFQKIGTASGISHNYQYRHNTGIRDTNILGGCF